MIGELGLPDFCVLGDDERRGGRDGVGVGVGVGVGDGVGDGVGVGVGLGLVAAERFFAGLVGFFGGDFLATGAACFFALAIGFLGGAIFFLGGAAFFFDGGAAFFLAGAAAAFFFFGGDAGFFFGAATFFCGAAGFLGDGFLTAALVADFADFFVAAAFAFALPRMNLTVAKNRQRQASRYGLAINCLAPCAATG